MNAHTKEFSRRICACLKPRAPLSHCLTAPAFSLARPPCYTVALMARQRLGQHFLADPGWREEIARAIRVSPQSISPSTAAQNKDFCWLEIGAGHGEITEHLASTGAPVYAVE